MSTTYTILQYGTEASTAILIPAIDKTKLSSNGTRTDAKTGVISDSLLYINDLTAAGRLDVFNSTILNRGIATMMFGHTAQVSAYDDVTLKTLIGDAKIKVELTGPEWIPGSVWIDVVAAQLGLMGPTIASGTISPQYVNIQSRGKAAIYRP